MKTLNTKVKGKRVYPPLTSKQLKENLKLLKELKKNKKDQLKN